MRRFITKIIYIFLPILVSALFIEILLRNTPNDYLFKKEYLDAHSSAIETLILGSSHSFYGFNPTFFTSKTFNASHISQTLDYDLQILHKYQSNLVNLKTIVLPISYFTLFHKLETEPESWRLKNYTIYYGMNTSESFFDYSEVLSNRINVNLRRLTSYYIFGKSTISCSDLGWGTNYKSENAKDLIETGKIASKQHTIEDIYSEKYQGNFSNNILVLNAIIGWCKKRNVKILLITPPAFKTYRHNLNAGQLDSTIETINKIVSKYDNCIYLDLLSDTGFMAKDFFDADHLSEIGAAKLSTLVDHKINEWK